MIRHLFPCVALLCLFAGCGAGDEKADFAKGGGASTVEKFLTLSIDEKQVKLPVELFDIYVVALSSNDPETFELHGPGVMLAGTLPKKLRVGFDAHYDVLYGKPIPVSPRGGKTDKPKDSKLTIPGIGNFQVTGGTITLDKTFGAYADDKAASGTVKINLSGPSGAKTAEGPFVVRIFTSE